MSALVFCPSQVIVFEMNIPIQLAFYALLEHDSVAAPLWDSVQREFVGLMTITDFVDILRHYHDEYGRTGAAIEVLASRSIAQVMNDADAGKRFKHAAEAQIHKVCSDHVKSYGRLVAVDANGELKLTAVPQYANILGSLYDACNVMRTNGRRFLPIITPEDCGVLAVVTHVDILEYFVATFREERRLFDQSVRELGIGTFDRVVSVARTTPLRDVLKILSENDFSSLPIVDETGRVDALYSRADITFLATATDADSVVVNLSSSIADVLQQRRSEEPLHTCSQHATLQFVFELFAEVKFRRLVCLDDDHRPVGVIAARDLLSYFLQ
mmetsp:Transcript_13256/g.40848  ORF Transcript_13256/g.40848 Transcript_13256/m.40848 type:complete len:327 (-) Transcript_13256:92-1072(-)